MYLKTPAACRKLGVPYTTMISQIRLGHVTPPEKDSSGDYVWTDADIERARQQMDRKPAESVR